MMHRFDRSIVVPMATLLGLTAAAPTQARFTPAGCDNSAINWFKPGEFEAARQLAQSSGRLLVIKGISFGVDDVGAQCATKGMW